VSKEQDIAPSNCEPSFFRKYCTETSSLHHFCSESLPYTTAVLDKVIGINGTLFRANSLYVSLVFSTSRPRECETQSNGRF